MQVLAIGDVVGSAGCGFIRRHLPHFKKLKGIDIVIANGENSADGNGILPASAAHLMESGVDVITTGNHVLRRKEIYDELDSNSFLLRPANYPAEVPGKGICIVDKGRYRLAVMNIMGTVFMENLACPFETADRLLALAKEEGAKYTVVDFHAEATAEKRAVGFYLDGRVSVLFGTHTHVATADAQVLPWGTGYITDIGMTGPADSVLGVKPELAIHKMRTKMPVRFDYEDAPVQMDGCIFTVDSASGKTVGAERVSIK
ncbi:MAG TPA: TIGR00282 family metallophosphoesterase [Ruminococcaceae bacterium]|nr:TIGR00282 family metallophosphoesterase [Oscillospiraceae bacterium]